jgi:anaerobic ribonucleoside-triphosphate reductase activating protein
MPEITIALDTVTGAVLTAGPDRLPKEFRDQLTRLLGPGAELGCARPLEVLPPPSRVPAASDGTAWVRVAGYYHNSLVEGPGRRSSVLLSGCALACPSCWVPALHAPEAGSLVPVDIMAEALLDPAYERDGVSILGGEPFLQPEGLLALIQALRARGCPHIVCYSGYTYEGLLRRSVHQPAIVQVLDEVDVLIDGPYVAALADRAGPWTGSGNQRVIDLGATRRAGQLALLDEWSLHPSNRSAASASSPAATPSALLAGRLPMGRRRARMSRTSHATLVTENAENVNLEPRRAWGRARPIAAGCL